ncbi:MAG TPA: DUF4890 domain-containing protein [Candidatus Alistipes faecavium]|uniref:DUF4890 domain-containing protein n=1 Tax=uncultured Alistipes sp. TaxID=538949 RepID=UPI001F95F2C1|nr:DUF4890 domain-containing protein [uncultured Alistipes sp.]HJA96513.1 DUF4890 domain-containing protein [Candidatus Alistipes faecavium]
MKKKIFVAAATFCMFCVTGVLAQEPTTPATPPTPPTAEQMAQRQTERMTQQLKLSDDQARKVYDINLKQAKEMQAVHQKMKSMREERAEKMKSILSTDQFVQWAQMQRPDRMGGMHERHHDRKAPDGKDYGRHRPDKDKARDQDRK